LEVSCAARLVVAVGFGAAVGLADVDFASVSPAAAAEGLIDESCVAAPAAIAVVSAGAALGAMAVVSIGAAPLETAAESDCPARWPPPQAASTTRIPARLSPAIVHLRGTKP
jgi:hypothetical protein